MRIRDSWFIWLFKIIKAYEQKFSRKFDTSYLTKVSQFYEDSQESLGQHFLFIHQWSQMLLLRHQEDKAHELWFGYKENDASHYIADYYQGCLYYYQKKYPQAVKCFEQWLSSKSDEETLVYGTYLYAVCCEQLNRYETAEKIFNQLLGQEDPWLDHQKNGIYAHLYQMYGAQQKFKCQQKALVNCLEQDSDARWCVDLHKSWLAESYDSLSPGVFIRKEMNTVHKILVCLLGPMGDALMVEPVCEALKQKYPQATLTLALTEACRSLADGFTVDDVIFWGNKRFPEGWPKQDILEKSYDIIVSPLPKEGELRESYLKQGLHQIQFMANVCQVSLARKRPQWQVDPVLKQKLSLSFAQAGLKPKSYGVIAYKALSARNWSLADYQNFAELWTLHHPQIPLMSISGAHSEFLPGTVPFCDRSMTEVQALMEGALFYLGPDTGVSWLAVTAECPIWILMDEQRRRFVPVGFQSFLHKEKEMITEIPVEQDPGRFFR